MAVVYCLVLLVTSFAITARSEPCATPNSTEGECIDINQCQPILDLQNHNPLTREDIKYLQRSQCGFSGTTANVCCPKSNAIRPFVLPHRPAAEPVTPSLGNRFGDDDDDEDEEDSNSENQKCGVQYSKDRIFDGTITELEEFPWMALLIYQTAKGPGLACGGVLINKRYILTAAHCVTGPYVQKLGKLIAVRLGEYDTQTQEDCDESAIEDNCAPPPVDIFVESAHPHPDYVPATADRHHDIALLRLKNAVRFTKFVRAICLPTTDHKKFYNNPGTTLVICGWGKTEHADGSPIKLKAKVPVIGENECKNPYQAKGIRIADTQICAGGGKTDSCKGDSGGPLMLEDKTNPNESRWYTLGVISFGSDPCANIGVPAVYTRTVPYLNWINSTIQP